MIIELTNHSYQVVTSTSVQQNISLGKAIDLIILEWTELSQQSEDEVIDPEEKLEAITAKLEAIDDSITKVLDKLKDCRL